MVKTKSVPKYYNYQTWSPVKQKHFYFVPELYVTLEIHFLTVFLKHKAN